VGVCRVVIVRL